MGMMGSIVLAADDPAALARFYGALLEVGPQPGLSDLRRPMGQQDPGHLQRPWVQSGKADHEGDRGSGGGAVWRGFILGLYVDL